MNPLSKINSYFNQQPVAAMKAVGQQFGGSEVGGKAVNQSLSSYSTNNIFAGKTSGINEKMNGQAMYTQGMAGVDAGVAGKKLNLVG